MALLRTLAIAFAGAVGSSFACAGAATCWISKIVLVDGSIHVSFSAPAPLVISGTAAPIGEVIHVPFAATYALGQGQALQIRSSQSDSERCELEPVIGPAFNGVARNVWLFKAGTSELIAMATIVEAAPK